jgi:hypothetical protein
MLAGGGGGKHLVGSPVLNMSHNMGQLKSIPWFCRMETSVRMTSPLEKMQVKNYVLGPSTQ